MRKFIALAILAVTASLPLSAQFRYGAMIGTDITSLKFKQDLFTVDNRVGFEAGVNSEMMFPGIGFGIGTGIYYAMEGAKLGLGEKEIWASQGYGNLDMMLHYAKIPFNVRFKWTRMSGLEEYIAPLVWGGPTIGFMVGHSKCDAMKYAGADIGLEVGFGFELYKHWQLTAVKNWGTTYSLKTKLLDDFSARNRSWSIRLTYFFDRNPKRKH